MPHFLSVRGPRVSIQRQRITAIVDDWPKKSGSQFWRRRVNQRVIESPFEFAIGSVQVRTMRWDSQWSEQETSWASNPAALHLLHLLPLGGGAGEERKRMLQLIFSEIRADHVDGKLVVTFKPLPHFEPYVAAVLARRAAESRSNPTSERKTGSSARKW